MRNGDLPNRHGDSISKEVALKKHRCNIIFWIPCDKNKPFSQTYYKKFRRQYKISHDVEWIMVLYNYINLIEVIFLNIYKTKSNLIF